MKRAKTRIQSRKCSRDDDEMPVATAEASSEMYGRVGIWAKPSTGRPGAAAGAR